MKNERIVCLVPSLTELLVDLGLRSQIVGVTKYCIHPDNLSVSRVSGTKNPNLTKIIDLQPTYLLCNREENRLEDINYLKSALPKCRMRITDVGSFEDSLSTIELIAEDLDVSTKANELISELHQIMKNLIEVGQKFSSKPIKVLYLIWKKPWMTIGTDTYIYSMLKSLNLVSCIDDIRYPILEADDLFERDWDVLLLSSEPYPFKDSDCLELTSKTQRPVILVDGEHYSWYGSRLKYVEQTLRTELSIIFNS
ncbi:MAG: helical backbone metal receptor [bacterium]|nr:helical backbone metal receptor [bacterium]